MHMPIMIGTIPLHQNPLPWMQNEGTPGQSVAQRQASGPSAPPSAPPLPRSPIQPSAPSPGVEDCLGRKIFLNFKHSAYA